MVDFKNKRVIYWAFVLVLGTLFIGCDAKQAGKLSGATKKVTVYRSKSKDTPIVLDFKDKSPQSMKVVSGDFVDVRIANQTFKLELAIDPYAQYKGLGDRKEIPVDSGMIFIYEKSVKTSFVMRKCFVPIDLIFVNDSSEIVTLHRSMAVTAYDTAEGDLKRYPSYQSIIFAIELKSGTIDKLKLKEGQSLGLPVDELKQFVH